VRAFRQFGAQFLRNEIVRPLARRGRGGKRELDALAAAGLGDGSGRLATRKPTQAIAGSPIFDDLRQHRCEGPDGWPGWSPVLQQPQAQYARRSTSGPGYHIPEEKIAALCAQIRRSGS